VTAENAETRRRQNESLPLPNLLRIPKMAELVTIATYNDVSDARLAKSKLEAAGILSFLIDENMVSTGGNWIAFGGVKLQVSTEDLPVATELLREPPRDDDPF